MNFSDYPLIDEAALKIVIKKLEQDPNYLQSEVCPYSDTTKNIFNNTKKETIVNNIDDVKNTLAKLNEQLKAQSDRFDANDLAPAESNAYLKTRLAMARELIELEEKLANLQQVNTFYAVVMTIMEEELDEYTDVRTKIMERLKSVTNS